MIAWLIKLTGLDSIFVYLILGGLIAAGILGFGWYERHQGYNQAATEYSLKIENMKRVSAEALAKELERQAHANEIAATAQAAKLKELSDKNVSLEQTIKENEDAAEVDPNANRTAISVDGVRRINRVH